MDLLLLGGLSAHNQPWIKDVGQALKPLANKTAVHQYAHWQTGGDIDIEHELKAVAPKAQQLGDYLIFAKSIGAVIAAMGIERRVLKPKACVFAGLPLELIIKSGFAFTEWLKTGIRPIVFVQNTNDPAGSCLEVRTYLQTSGLDNYQLLELPGDTHSYTNLDKLKEIVGEAMERVKQ